MAGTVTEKKQRRGEILAELKAVREAAKLGKRDLTEEEGKTLEARLAEDAALKADIDKAEKAAASLAAIDALDEELAAIAQRKTQPDPVGQLQPVEKPGFKSLGEQLQAIAQADITNRAYEDKRLVYGHLAVSGASEGVPSDGGYLVQKDFVAELQRRMYEMGQILRRVKRLPISANANGIKVNAIDETSRATGSRWGGVQMYWAAEADSATAKKPRLRLMELELKKLIGLAYMTDELLADAAALAVVFSDAFSEDTTFMVEDSIVNGDGAGKPLGIASAPAVVSVAKETGQAAATVVYQNIVKMWSRMWGRSRQDAVWLINQDVEPQLNAMTLTVGTGGVPVYMPAGGLSASPYGSLMGRPVIPVEYCATLGTVMDIVLADFSQYVMIDKGAPQADSSMHVRFINHEMTFRYVYRCDGQPTWNSALTPFKGTNTQSPFITLATRA